MKKILLSGIACLAFAGVAYADCPAITVADMQGVAPGAYPEQYNLSEFEKAANCKMTFSENPSIAKLNAQIQGNPDKLPPVAERLPEDPLVMVPYDSIGKYGGTFRALSNATEARRSPT